MFRKINCFIIGIMMIACVFSSCTNSQEATGDETGDEKIVYTWMIPTQQQSPVYSSAIVTELKKRFNVDFDFKEIVAGTQYDQKKSLNIGGNSIPDIMSWVTRDEVNQYGPLGAFIEISKHLDKLPNLKAKIDSDSAKIKDDNFDIVFVHPFL